jgi:hypothetical protein
MNKPSWFVALSGYFSISRVEVYNRVDCCNDRIRDFVINIYRGGMKVYTSEPSTDIRNSYSIRLPNIVGDKVGIEIPHNGRILSLAEVKVFGVETQWDGPVNVALASNGATAYQSKTGYDGVASRAIDGNDNGYWGGGSVTHSWPNLYNPFWEVRLNSFYNITQVEVFNRIDCCSERIKEFVLTIYAGGFEVYSVQADSDITNYYSFEIPGIVGDVVEIMLPGSGRTLSLAEVKVLGIESDYNGPVLPDNIALASNGAVATQSYTTHGGSASRAIDGNTDGNWGGGSVTHTAAMANPYWEVALGDYYNVTRVDVYNRLDCCSDRLTNFVLNVYRGGINIYSVNSNTRDNFYKLDVPNVICDKVQIMLPGNSRILSLAEVLVYGEKTEWDGAVYSNVALASNGATASHSQTSHDGEASRAIDGNRNGGWNDRSVTHTDWRTDPFWEVTLAQAYYIARVDVFNRVDCCTDRIREFMITMFKDGEEVFSEQADSKILSFYTFLVPDISVDKVRISLQGDRRVLSLAEVEVIGTETAPDAAGKKGVKGKKKKPVVIQTVEVPIEVWYTSKNEGESAYNETTEPPVYDDEYNSTNPEDYEPDDEEEENEDDELTEQLDDVPIEDVDVVDDDSSQVEDDEKDYSLDDTPPEEEVETYRTPEPTKSPVASEDEDLVDDIVNSAEDDEKEYLLDDTPVEEEVEINRTPVPTLTPVEEDDDFGDDIGNTADDDVEAYDLDDELFNIEIDDDRDSEPPLPDDDNEEDDLPDDDYTNDRPDETEVYEIDDYGANEVDDGLGDDQVRSTARPTKKPVKNPTASPTEKPTKDPTSRGNPDTSSPTATPSSMPTVENDGDEKTMSPSPTIADDGCCGTKFSFRGVVENLLDLVPLP